MNALLEPLSYDFMLKALLSSAAVGGVCALLSVFLMLKGWSLIGDALSHAVVPGVALAYLWRLPYALGAFTTGILAAAAMLLLKRLPMLRQDAIIGFVFTLFFAAGLFIISLYPTAVNLQAVIYGNILGIDDHDLWQMLAILHNALKQPAPTLSETAYFGVPVIRPAGQSDCPVVMERHIAALPFYPF